MSSETTLLPRKWFAAAAIFSLLLAGLTALLLFAPHPREPGIGLPTPTTLGLRQRDNDGLPIPWGTTISGAGVRIEVAGADPKGIKEIELFLSQDGAPPIRQKHEGTGADLKQLTAGRYRWSAVVHPLSDVPMELQPPRGDPLAADFVVAPPVLDLPPLQQRTLGGQEPIEIGGQTRAGAKLGAQFPEALPGAVLEVESKPAARTFDGSGTRRIPVEQGDVSIDFAGPEGAYRWRARLVAASQSRTEWRAFGDGPSADFVIFATPTTQPSKKNGDSGVDQDNGSNPANENSEGENNSSVPPGNGGSNPADKNKNTPKHSDKPPSNGDQNQSDKKPDPKPDSAGDGKGTPGARAYSSGMGSGYRGPLPSRVRPLPSLWHLALFRMALIFGGIIATLAIMLLTMKVIRGARPRAASVP